MKDKKNVSLSTGDLEDSTYRKIKKRELVRIIEQKGWPGDSHNLMRGNKDSLIQIIKLLSYKK